MQLQPKHIVALDKAESMMFHHEFCPYLELKALLLNASVHARTRFRSLFINYYGLNIGGLTDAFKDRFFAILFDGKIMASGRPVFTEILSELSMIPGKNGHCVMPFSFVSKLVAIHRESSPIYDRHVLGFFEEEAPTAAIPKADRIMWYVDFLNQVAADYATWARDERVAPILKRFKARDGQLARCDVVRLLDFLVWKVGNQKLLAD